MLAAARNGRPAGRATPAPRRSTASPERFRAARPAARPAARRTARASSPRSTTCTRSARLRGVETVVLRYFNVFGPGQDPTSEYAAVVPRFVTAALEATRPSIYGDGDAVARLHLRRQRRRGEPAGRRPRRASTRPDLQRRLRRPPHPARAARRDRRARRAPCRPDFGPPVRATSCTRRRTSLSARELWLRRWSCVRRRASPTVAWYRDGVPMSSPTG